MGGAGNEGQTALPVPGHGAGFGGGGGPVVDGGVTYVHARELADLGLILEDGLEHALAHLGLVGRVGGQELLLGGDVLDDAGDVVVVGPGATKGSAPPQGNQPSVRQVKGSFWP